MPGCVLRAAGRDFDADAFLAGSPLCPCVVYRRGEPRGRRSGRMEEASGFKVDVGPPAGDAIAAQIRDATAFVEAHRDELARLAGWPGVESVTLDFGWSFSGDHPAQFAHLPPEFLAACGALRVGIEVSVYATSS